ncbi:MAG: PKD domain-containing protein [Nanoarchaeota archaeon]
MKKRGMLILILMLCLISYSNAQITVGNISLNRVYYPYENISGEINLSIKSEPINQYLNTNLNQNLSLINFFELNDANYNCIPSDCSVNYNLKERADEFQLLGDKTIGFSLKGKNIQIQGISFDMQSNFSKSQTIPLKIRFFENLIWEFTNSSGEYSASKNWGCYNDSLGKPEFYIRQYYCEKFEISRTNSIKAGARLEVNGTDKLKLLIRDWTGQNLGDCEFLPATENSCIFNREGGYSAGIYYVCILPSNTENVANIKHKIYSENVNKNCGWPSLPSTENSTRDFGIFLTTELFSSASLTNINNGVVKNLESSANSFIRGKFDGDCSNGCIFPILFQGIPQEIEISNVRLAYQDNEGSKELNDFFNLEVKPADVDFSGILNLNLSGFNVQSSGDKNLQIKLGETILFDNNISVLDAPIIQGIYPLNPPAGVPVIFTAKLISKKNISAYYWDFGDGIKQTAYINSINHTYKEAGSFIILLNVTDSSGIMSSKSFEIFTGTPAEIVDIILKIKQDKLKKTEESMNKFSSEWYFNGLQNVVALNYYKDELKKIEDGKVNASEEENLKFVTTLQNLKFPSLIFSKGTSTTPLSTDLEDIDASQVALISEEEIENPDAYSEQISKWQNENYNSSLIQNQKIMLLNEDKEDVVIDIYELDIVSNSDEDSYFLISKPREELFFENEDSAVEGQEGYTVVSLKPNERKKLNFYKKNDEELIFFASPKLSSLQEPIEIKVEACNFNKICEEDLDENSKNCQNDCGGFFSIRLIFPILVILFGLIIYTILQVWYKNKYETFLFKDRSYLFNLLMFIDNARIRGIEEGEIKEQLKIQKWSGEQISYALKKSLGKRTGMYEIIPIEKIFAWFRIKKARQNINKPQIQGNY